MNYEQKYKEAIESIKRIYNQADSYGKELMEKEFPDLTESKDERIRKEIIELVHFFYCSSSVYEQHVSEDDMIAWLESIKDMVQPKQEWSEEDEKRVNSIISSIEYCSEQYPDRKEYAKDINWLKSLKPQNHWKPSEEQMQALFEAKLASINNREYFLGLLYEDLKKL